jgi:hypothetical protein
MRTEPGVAAVGNAGHYIKQRQVDNCPRADPAYGGWSERRSGSNSRS